MTQQFFGDIVISYLAIKQDMIATITKHTSELSEKIVCSEKTRYQRKVALDKIKQIILSKIQDFAFKSMFKTYVFHNVLEFCDISMEITKLMRKALNHFDFIKCRKMIRYSTFVNALARGQFIPCDDNDQK